MEGSFSVQHVGFRVSMFSGLGFSGLGVWAFGFTIQFRIESLDPQPLRPQNRQPQTSQHSLGSGFARHIRFIGFMGLTGFIRSAGLGFRVWGLGFRVTGGHEPPPGAAGRRNARKDG